MVETEGNSAAVNPASTGAPCSAPFHGREFQRTIGFMTSSRILCTTLALLFTAAHVRADTPLGIAPTYTSRALSPEPNAQAITKRIWIPGIDDGYVPQGLLYLDGQLFLSSYRSTDRNQNSGPCRLYAIDPERGTTLGHLDLPPACGHAGGVAKGRPGHILVVDSKVLFEIAIENPPASEIGRVTRSVKLSGAVKGSFAAASGDGFWIGAYERNGAASAFQFPWNAIGKTAITERDAIGVRSIPLQAQGAAFDADTNLWVMRSGSSLGELVRLSADTGETAARYAMPIGSENISFDADGNLWTLSEAGSIRWSEWRAHYPLIFRFDVRLLK